ncbi:MAG: hypothetical protein OHK0029_33280 [Armatimonadaceae bacterium]
MLHALSRFPKAMRFAAAVVVLAGSAGITAGAMQRSSSRQASERTPPFDTNVRVEKTDSHYIVRSDGIPNHTTAEFPNKDNPNRIRRQNYTFFIPRQPQRAAKPTPLPMGPIGVAVNGVPFYNPYNAEGLDAVSGLYAEVFDSCCGHPDQMGRYHYHKYPVCLKTPFQDKEGQHSPLIGYAFDGYAIYGPKGENGSVPKDLDAYNGHTDRERSYHYHVSEKFPYLIGGYRGVVDLRNFDRPGMHQRRNGAAYPMDRSGQ